MRPATPTSPPPRAQRSPQHAELQPAPVSQPQPANEPRLRLEDADILPFVPELERMLAETVKEGVPPDTHAKKSLEQHPQLRLVAPSLSVEFIVGAIQRSGGSSPLVRRDGQRFLRQFHQELLRQAS